MGMIESGSDIEPRWPVALAILAVLCVLISLPGTIRIVPLWFAGVVALTLLVPVLAVASAADKSRWLRIERRATLIIGCLGVITTVSNLAVLIAVMIRRSGEIRGEQLLASSIGVWVTNVLIFSLLYWQLDRGGPTGRTVKVRRRADWLFPQEGTVADVVRPGWEPTYADYLFLAYTTATAFSTTDVVPLTTRAKLLMMLQSAISLVTLVVVASRAINILGG